MASLFSTDTTVHEVNNPTEPYRFEPERVDEGIVSLIYDENSEAEKTAERKLAQ